ncbi:MAG TPA: phosphatidylserine decarboxylase [Vicinamibacteria bacterium]|nr:phosphatidylserine decarboxylase [Vicinamibacteria bacterium]
MSIAPQGLRYILLLVVAAGLAYVVFPIRAAAGVLLGLALFVAFFFRDPTRVPPADPRILVSPGDGKVVSVGPGKVDPSWTEIAIFLSIFDVHINRSPLAAVARAIRYTPGRFMAAYKSQAGSQNERNEIELADGDYVVMVRQIAGVVARRIICTVREGESLGRGQRIGLIQFGSRMEVAFPPDTEPLVQVGDRVRGGETPIGRRT